MSREILKVREPADLVRVRRQVTSQATSIGFGTYDRTRLVTAASELTRNLLTYGGGGEVSIEEVVDTPRRGMRLTFEDKGPGIADLDEALRDGFTSGGGMGLGLSGARRLSDDFHVDSTVGVGTTIRLARWLSA